MNRYTRQLIDKQLPDDKAIRQFIIEVADILDLFPYTDNMEDVLAEQFELLVKSFPEAIYENE